MSVNSTVAPRCMLQTVQYIGTCDECSEHAQRKFPASPEISLLGLRLGVITKRFQEQAFKAVSARITPQAKADCACNLRFLGSVCMLRWLGALKPCSLGVQRYRGSLYLYTCSFGCVHSCCTLNTHGRIAHAHSHTIHQYPRHASITYRFTHAIRTSQALAHQSIPSRCLRFLIERRY